MSEKKNEFDVIILGAGISGLACAATAASIGGKKILIIEKHYILGGYLHTFNLKGRQFDVGMHYVGEVQKGSFARALFNFVAGERVLWSKLDSPFESFIFPDYQFDVPNSKIEYILKLASEFPNEIKAIKKYVSDIGNLYRFWLLFYLSPNFLKKLLKIIFRKNLNLSRMTAQSYMDSNFKSEKLRSVLLGQWMGYGTPPSMTAFKMHSLYVQHYINGGYYPEKSTKTLIGSIENFLKKRNVTICKQAEVVSFLIEKGQIKGVMAKQGDGMVNTYFAKNIFSSMGLQQTYSLIPKEYISEKSQKEICDIPKGYSCLWFNIGLNNSLKNLGFKNQNYWFFSGYDHNKIYSQHTQKKVFEPLLAFCSTCGFHQPATSKHMIQFLAPVSFELVSKWANTVHKDRPHDYIKFKNDLSETLLNFIETKFPGFKNSVDFVDVSTPLTSIHYTNHPYGQIYGVPHTPERINMETSEIKTPVKGLYLIGADVFTHGIYTCLISGIYATAKSLNCFEKSKLITLLMIQFLKEKYAAITNP